MGSSPDDPFYPANGSQKQVAVTLTHAIEMQQTEMTRKQWRDIVGNDTQPSPDLACLEDNCPVTQITWWEAVLAANLLSEQKGLNPCYKPLNCSGEMGRGRICEGFENPLDVIYSCEGYRLPTRAESEYSARAGTITHLYSGELTVYENPFECHPDPHLEKIAWYCFNSGGKTHPVAQLEPNNFGLFDQLGNVEEWLNDVDYAAPSPGGKDPEGWVSQADALGRESERVLRSGRATLTSIHSRAAGRTASSWDSYSVYSALIGFRLVRTLPD